MSDQRYEFAMTVAREAGAVLRKYFGKRLDIRKKGKLDLVTQADMEAEQLVTQRIVEAFGDDGILGEEGSQRQGVSGYHWVIDPLDGTTNFAHQLPQFCVSIGLEYQGQVIAGVLYDPIKEELFDARSGGGARLNGQPIQVGGRSSLNEALVVTGYSYDRRERIDQLLDRTRRILLNAQGLRRLGSAALDLAYVACGRFDVFIEDGLSAWDIAAGQLLVQEAGGTVSNLAGEPLDIRGGSVLACNGALRPAALQHLCGLDQ